MRSIQKCLSVCLACLMLAFVCGMFPLTAFADDEILAEGSCGENVSYTITSDGVLTISGMGAMTDYDYDDNQTPFRYWTADHPIRTVVVKEGVTHIGAASLTFLAYAWEISIPCSVTSIGEDAFRGNYSLVRFKVASDNPVYSSPDGVLIDKAANTLLYYPAHGVAYPDAAPHEEPPVAYTVPAGIQHIGDWAFYTCHYLQDVTLPDELLTIGEGAFFECSALKHIHFNEGLREIGKAAFYTCTSLEEIILPESVENVEELAFYCCSADTPEVTGVTDIVLHCGITEIKQETFPHAHQLKTLTLTNKVTKIGPSAFNDCPNLTDIYFEGTPTEWNAVTVEAGNDALAAATVHYIPTEVPDEPGPAPSGFAAVIQKIQAFFQRIADFFKSLFQIA